MMASGALTRKPLSNICSLGNEADEWRLTSRTNKGKSVAVLNSLTLSHISDRNTKISLRGGSDKADAVFIHEEGDI